MKTPHDVKVSCSISGGFEVDRESLHGSEGYKDQVEALGKIVRDGLGAAPGVRSVEDSPNCGNTYWSSLPPAHLLPRQPFELLRAREGLRPLCYNRAPFETVMSQDCKAWAVAGFENPGTDSVPAREGWRCHGCKWLPDDQRVIERVKESGT